MNALLITFLVIFVSENKAHSNLKAKIQIAIGGKNNGIQ